MLETNKYMNKLNIDIRDLKPLIKKNQETGEMVAGFLNAETGEYTVDMEIKTETDIDVFLDKYDLSVVMISNTWV